MVMADRVEQIFYEISFTNISYRIVIFLGIRKKQYLKGLLSVRRSFYELLRHQETRVEAVH